MGDTELYLACLRDPRLAAHATSAHPAWLWSLDGKRSLWANASGAALLGAKNPAELNARTLGEGDAMRAQIARLGASLPRSEKPRLERLRGFGSGLGRLLTCACSRITLDDQTAVLVAATERAGPELSLRERVQRLHAAVKAPVAVFSADGALLYVDKTLAPRLGDDKTLTALGAASLAAEALRTGRARGMIDGVPASLDRVGSSAATVLVALFAESAAVDGPVQAIDAPGPSGPHARVEVPSQEAPTAPVGAANVIGKAADKAAA